MRQRDYIPLVLLAGIAAFVLVQGGRGRQSTPRRDTGKHASSTIAPAAALDSAAVDSAPMAHTADSAADTLTAALAKPQPQPQGEPAATAASRELAALHQKIRDGAPGTYLLAMLAQDSMLTRWPDHRVNALRVWIERYSALPDFQPTYPVVAEHAFDEWHEAGFPLRFDIVSDSLQADIRIQWVNTIEDSEDNRIGSTTKTRDSSGWITAADIRISTHDRDTGEPLSASIIAGIARHEVGHALGLGHSAVAGDVMFPESRTPNISRADRATLHLLYILPPGATR